MASLNYLYSNRAKFPFGSSAFFKSWAKRLILLPSLMKRNWKRQLLVSKGAQIHERAGLGEVRIDGPKKNLTIGSQSFLGRVITIENYAWVGIGAMILPGVTIGRGAVVGARAVVSKNVAPGAIVVGIPPAPINKKRTENLIYDPCEFLAANRA